MVIRPETHHFLIILLSSLILSAITSTVSVQCALGHFFQLCSVWFSSVQLPSCVRLFATPWTAARQASLTITNSQSLLKLMSIELVMPSNHLILCHPLPSVFASIRVFSNESNKEMWMNLESVTQNEVSQKEKNKYHILTCICGFRERYR